MKAHCCCGSVFLLARNVEDACGDAQYSGDYSGGICSVMSASTCCFMLSTHIWINNMWIMLMRWLCPTKKHRPQPNPNDYIVIPEGVNAYCQPEGVTAYCQPEGMKAYCQPEGIKAYCQPEGVNAYCQPEGVKTYCQPEGVNAHCQPEGVNAYCQPKPVNDYCQPHVINSYCQREGVGTYYEKKSVDLCCRSEDINSYCEPKVSHRLGVCDALLMILICNVFVLTSRHLEYCDVTLTLPSPAISV